MRYLTSKKAFFFFFPFFCVCSFGVFFLAEIAAIEAMLAQYGNTDFFNEDHSCCC